MHFLLDTANVEAIRAACAVYPIAGVTTNPTNVARETAPLRELIAGIRGVIGRERLFHVQVVAGDADGMLAEARLLAEIVGPGFCCKVPVTPDGLAAIRRIVAAGMVATATSVSSVGQAVLAARAGAAYVIPYVNRMDVAEGSGSGSALVADIVSAYRLHGIGTRLIAASVKTRRAGAALLPGRRVGLHRARRGARGRRSTPADRRRGRRLCPRLGGGLRGAEHRRPPARLRGEWSDHPLRAGRSPGRGTRGWAAGNPGSPSLRAPRGRRSRARRPRFARR